MLAVLGGLMILISIPIGLVTPLIPIGLPIGIVGAEEISPGIARLESVAHWLGAPALPLTWTMPWLGPAGFIPLPSKFRIRFGEPLHFDGDPNDEDAVIEDHVDVVKDAIRRLVQEGLAARDGGFS